MSDVSVRWVVTANNPRQWKRYDGGTSYPRSGWCRHAVIAASDPAAMPFAPAALCGLTPSSGWGGDLFEDDMPECKRCARRLDMMDPPIDGAPILACEKCSRTDRMGRGARFTADEIARRPPEQRERYRQAWQCWCYRCNHITYQGLR
jgi:hypothetical protein